MLDFSRNPFELFGLAPRFGLDVTALDAAYRRLQSEVHPDRHAHGGDADKRLALQASAQVNEAYRILRNPVTRAEHLLALHGIDVAQETDTRLPLDFLERQLERREQAAEAAAERDVRTLGAVLDEVRRDARTLEDQLAVALDERRAYAEARTPVRELRFLSKVTDDLAALDASLDESLSD